MEGMEATHQFQESLKGLKKTGSIAEYQQQFEALLTKIHGVPERWLVQSFITGLHEYLKCQLRLARPISYSEAVELGRLHEPNYLAWKGSLKRDHSNQGNVSQQIQETHTRNSTQTRTMDSARESAQKISEKLTNYFGV